MNTLDELRRQLDDIDSRIAPLIAERMALSSAIGDLKRTNGVPVTDSSREQQVMQHAAELSRAKDEQTARAVAQVYEAILSASRAIQEYPAEGSR